MRKAIASFGTGPAAATLAVALPTFRAYADRHGYDVLTEPEDPCGRPASWGKVPLLRRLIQTYDFVLWIDADAIIVDGSVDIEEAVPPEAFQAYVLQPDDVGPLGPTPCLGVWALRSGERTQQFLHEVWAQEDLTDHRWWEQAAVMRLLGWRTEPRLAKDNPSPWDEGTYELPLEWGVIPRPWLGRPYAPARIRHYGAASTRRRLFEMRTDLAEIRGDVPRYWVGRLVRTAEPPCLRAWWRLKNAQGSVRNALPAWMPGSIAGLGESRRR